MVLLRKPAATVMCRVQLQRLLIPCRLAMMQSQHIVIQHATLHCRINCAQHPVSGGEAAPLWGLTLELKAPFICWQPNAGSLEYHTWCCHSPDAGWPHAPPRCARQQSGQRLRPVAALQAAPSSKGPHHPGSETSARCKTAPASVDDTQLLRYVYPGQTHRYAQLGG